MTNERYPYAKILLIVTALILIIAVIAISRYIRRTQSANKLADTISAGADSAASSTTPTPTASASPGVQNVSDLKNSLKATADISEINKTIAEVNSSLATFNR